jgi:hypothetical protein
MKKHTLGKWAPLRLIWNTDYLFPNATHPRPDGDRSCYKAGEWARRGKPHTRKDSMKAKPTGPGAANCAAGVCALCERDGEKDCWHVCLAHEVLAPTEYAKITTMLKQAKDIIQETLQVERIVGDMKLDASYPCANLDERLDRVPNGDLVLFVHSRPEKHTSTRAAFASSCQVDQNGK